MVEQGTHAAFGTLTRCSFMLGPQLLAQGLSQPSLEALARPPPVDDQPLVDRSVDGHQIEADLVLDASGRASRLLGARTGTVSVDCGITYASREYRLRQGASLGAMNFPIGLSLAKRGYQAIVFVHDNRVISVVITRATTDRELAGLREPAAVDAAVSAIPGLDEWTAPDRSLPITTVLPAARLFNSYRGQFDETGRLSLPGRILIGDAVSTTTPVRAESRRHSCRHERSSHCWTNTAATSTPLRWPSMSGAPT